MKNFLLLILSLLFFCNSKTVAQDAIFSQWENMPLYFNPALTGDFEGLVRFRGKHRNQWSSVLEDNSFKTSAASIEYKFNKGEQRKISVGFHSIFDKAGELNFRTKTFNLSTSIVQNLGDLESTHHSIGIGLNAGMGIQKVDFDRLRFGDSILDLLSGGPNNPMSIDLPMAEETAKVTFADFSMGLVWNYTTPSHFSFQLGSAFHHINRPDLSFSQNGKGALRSRFNLHGNVEIPLCKQLSIVPSFLYFSQSPGEQLLFGLSGKYYLKSSDANFIQLGFLGKTTDNFNGTRLNIYVLSATVEIKSILLGFSYDHFEKPLSSSAYEFSVGYTIGK